jgi:preprotein translocase subunit SecG
MQLVLLVLLLIVTVTLIAVVLMQKSEGGGLGAGGGNMGGVLSARGGKTFVSRLTGILGGTFLVLSLALAWLAKQPKEAVSLADKAAQIAVTPPATPAKPATPAVPLAQ